MSAYFSALIAVFVLAGLAGPLYVRGQSNQDAHDKGLHDASVAAQSAARLLGDGSIILQGALAGVSADPGAVRDLLAHPSSCGLSFAHIGAFPTGHIDLVRRDGRIVCSSLRGSPAATYAQQPWFSSSRLAAAAHAPARDPLTREPAAIFTAPFPAGVAAGVVDLRAIGPDLAAQLAGSRGIEYVVTAAGGRTILAESGRPARWAGARLAGPASFAGKTQPDRAGLDGRPRLFARATVAGLGWQVYAGLDRSIAMASASQLFHRELVVVVVGLLIVLAGAVVLDRPADRPACVGDAQRARGRRLRPSRASGSRRGG